MGRKQNRTESPPPAPEPEAAVVKLTPRAPVQVLYCAGALSSII